MLKTLKRKFLVAAIITITIVIGVIVSAINTFHFYSTLDTADATLATVLGDPSRIPTKLQDIIPGFHLSFLESSYYTEGYFTVTYTDDGEVTVNNKKAPSVSEGRAKYLAGSARDQEKSKGFTDKYRYMISVKGSTTTVALLDCTQSLDSVRDVVFLSIGISVFGILVVFLVLSIISESIVRPISEGYEKQKRFITDAGHDIKTPLAVINADAELLEMEIGDNEWLSDIKKQTERLTSLTGDLIYLSKMEEQQIRTYTDFPLSEAAEEIINSFHAPAITKGITIDSYIDPALYYNGHEDSIRKLLTLLIDNAIKYSPEGETVGVSIRKMGRTVTIKISNRAPGLSQKNVQHMFDRFYRSDASRSSSGGFGIGLSVAKAIVTSHKGRIYANKHRDLLVIDVILF